MFKKFSPKKLNLFRLNFGPQHPAAHGVLRLILDLQGEIILNIDPHIGLLHRGTEKLIEIKTWLQSLPYFDRLDYVSMMCQEHTWCLVIEKLLKLVVPLRAQYLRTIFLELTRILNHLLAISCHAMDVGAQTPFFWLFEEREKIIEFYERLSGTRMHSIFFRPGGILTDFSLHLLNDIYFFCFHLFKKVHQIEELLSGNLIWKQRLINIGSLSYDDAKLWGFSGILLRATGKNWDLRKNQPYEIYNKLEFNVLTGTNSDSYDRYLLRIYEIYESIKIIEQCLNSLPMGLVQNDNYQYNFSRTLIKTSMEKLINHFKFYYNEFVFFEDTTLYLSTETPKGEFGIEVITDMLSSKLYRCKIKAPGFNHLQALHMLASKYSLADLVAILGSLDIVFGEIDR